MASAGDRYPTPVQSSPMTSRREGGLYDQTPHKEPTVHNMIFVNLPVRDVNASRTFFSSLGYSFNEDFCDDKALCLVLGDNLYAMLLQRAFFQTFTPREVADAQMTTQVLVALSVDSREAVDELVSEAVTAGGAEAREPQDLGFMYGRSYSDLDGHIWEVLWTDPAAG